MLLVFLLPGHSFVAGFFVARAQLCCWVFCCQGTALLLGFLLPGHSFVAGFFVVVFLFFSKR